MLTAYHSMLVSDVRGAISGLDPYPLELTGEEPQVVQDMAEVRRNISVKNYRESYHDAIEYRDQMYSLFNLGMLGLEDRGKAEGLFWAIANKAVCHSKSAKFVAEESAARAGEVLASGVPGDADYEEALADFDFWLRSDGHARNPGTTADMIAAGLFVALRSGLLDAARVAGAIEV